MLHIFNVPFRRTGLFEVALSKRVCMVVFYMRQGKQSKFFWTAVGVSKSGIHPPRPLKRKKKFRTVIEAARQSYVSVCVHGLLSFSE